MRLIEKVWFHQNIAKWWLVPLLAPITLLFWLLSGLRRLLFKLGLKQQINLDCPVVVVGNIGVGGNGKTPVVVHLVEQLTKHGIKVGVLSRGYGGAAPYYPYLLTDESTALETGDEPILIYQRCGIDVAVGSDRIASAKLLINQGCQLIISDDGLQHYRLGRDYEICVIDGKRLFGNGLLLPSGPLREFPSRLQSLDTIIVNGELSKAIDTWISNYYSMSLQAFSVCNLHSGKNIPLDEFLAEQPKVNAIAGIGDPQRFFDTLTKLGFALAQQQGFNDHQAYNADTFSVFTDKTPLLMTEKDAVKCRHFAQVNWWYLPVEAKFRQNDKNDFVADIMQLITKYSNQ